MSPMDSPKAHTKRPPLAQQGTQAARIFAKFGSMQATVRALKQLGGAAARDASTVCRWNMDKRFGGTGGLIPLKAIPHVLAAATATGVVLTAEDLDPRVKTYGAGSQP